MARYLGIEWDSEGLRVVEATTRGGKALGQRALQLPEPLTLKPADALAAGQRLKEQLKAAKIAPGPTLVCVPRDRVVFRDVRYPDVPLHDAPEIVRFQAVKELTFPAEEGIIDYQAVSIPWSTGEQRALTVVVRKEVLTAIKKLCQGAGLKLEGVSARPFGVAATLAQVDPTPNASECIAGLVRSNGACELVLARGRELLFSRSLSLNGNGVAALVPELRRSLAAFGGAFPGQTPQRVFITGFDDQSDVETLTNAFHLPLFPYQTTENQSLPSSQAAAFAGALGLIHERAAGKPAVNLAIPKQAAPPTNRRKHAWLAGLAAAALLLAGVGVTYGVVSSGKTKEIKELQRQKADLKKQIDSFAEMEERLKGVNAWAGTEMVMLDELYDLIAYFPDQPGVRVTKAEWKTLAAPQSNQPTKQAAAAKTAPAAAQANRPIGVITLEATGDSSDSLNRLKAALENDDHWKLEHWEPNTPLTNQARCTLKVYRQLPHEYKLVLAPTEHTTSPSSGGGGGGDRRRVPGGGPGSGPGSGGGPAFGPGSGFGPRPGGGGGNGPGGFDRFRITGPPRPTEGVRP